jgi:creatinine amidohydrolase
MDIVARDLRVRLGMFAVATNLNGLGSIPEFFSPTERRHGIHGGSSETSQIMYLRPDLVRMNARRNFTPATIAWEDEYKYLRAESPGIGFGWQTQDLNPDGALGDATDADAGRGCRLTELRAAGLAGLVAEVIRFPLGNLKERAAR